VIISSSGCVDSMKAASPRRTVSGEPTNDTESERSTIAFSAGDQYEAMSSIGGGTWPGEPRRRLMNDCCCDVNWRRASASVSAASTLAPSMA